MAGCGGSCDGFFSLGKSVSKGSFTHPVVEERALSRGFSSSLWLVVLADTKAFIFFRFFLVWHLQASKGFFL